MLLDAEQSYIQSALGYFILLLQYKYNSHTPYVYGTYQCYRKVSRKFYSQASPSNRLLLVNSSNKMPSALHYTRMILQSPARESTAFVYLHRVSASCTWVVYLHRVLCKKKIEMF